MKKTLLALAVLLAFSGLRAAAATVAVYHTSDAHGWYSARPAQWDRDNSTRPIGGFAALSALLKKETNPYLLLDAGDMFQGTPEGILTKGMASMTLMNQLGYAAAVPGNHDYDYTEPNLQVLVSSAAFPFLGANVYYKDGAARVDYLKPYAVFEKAGRRIAVLGLAGAHTAYSTLPANVKHLDFRNEAAETAKWLPEVKALRPDAIIVLTHLGLDVDLTLKMVDVSTWPFSPAPAGTLQVARAAPGINLVLGGHNHTGLLKGYHDPVSGAWLGESRYGLSYVTRAELNFDDATGKLAGVKVTLVPLWIDETGEDAAVTKTLAGFSSAVDGEMSRLVGQAADDLVFSSYGLDSGIGNWLSDLTREAAGADLGFQNTDSIRAEIKKGPVTLRALYQAMPFDNTIITMRLNGTQLHQLMADNLNASWTAMQVSGLEVEYSPAGITLKHEGRLIKPVDEFTVATNNYLAYGGIGGAAFNGGKEIKDTLITMHDAMINAFADGPVKAPATGRIRKLK